MSRRAVHIRGRVGLVAVTALGLVGALARPALAAPEEIQVYEDDMDKPGRFGLDVHNNDVWGRASPLDYPGEQQPDYRYRVTPEFSYGLTPNLELGLYMPLATYQHGALDIAGTKVRIKYIAPHPKDQDWYWGANFEIGVSEHRLDINPGNAELKGIFGWRPGRWDLAFNTNIDFAVAGPHLGTPSIQLAAKVGYKIVPRLSVGFETYNGAGTFRDFGAFAGAGHSSFVVADTSFGKWDLNVGLGHGYSGEPDHWIFKFILGVPIDD